MKQPPWLFQFSTLNLTDLTHYISFYTQSKTKWENVNLWLFVKNYFLGSGLRWLPGNLMVMVTPCYRSAPVTCASVHAHSQVAARFVGYVTTVTTVACLCTFFQYN